MKTNHFLKKYRRLLWLIGVLFSFGMVLYITLYFVEQSNLKKFFLNITGQLFTADVQFAYESNRSFNGDGYSITVYELSPQVCDSLANPSNLFFEVFPENSRPRDTWITKFWQKTPISFGEKKIIDFGLHDLGAMQAMKSVNYFEVIRRILREKGHFYAYSHHSIRTGVTPNDIDLFILSPQNHLLIVINSNT